MDLIDRAITTYHDEQERKRIAREEYKARHLAEIKATAARYFDLEESSIFTGDEYLFSNNEQEYAVRVGDIEFSLPNGDLLVYYRCYSTGNGLTYDYMVAYHNQPIENLAKLGRMFVKHTCPCRKKKEIAA